MNTYLKYALKKRKLKKPVYLIFFVTNRCNSRCRHCFVDINKNKKELNLNEIEGFSKQLNDLGWLSISGGEPFLRKDLDEICKIFYKNNSVKNLTIPTNGILTDVIKKKMITILNELKNVNISLNLSLDGLEKTHDYIRGVNGSFKKLLKTYDEVKELKRDYKNFCLRINTTINNKNYLELKELDKFIRENLTEVDSHNLELMRGNPKGDKIKPLSLNQLNEVKPIIFSIFDNYDFFKSRIKSRFVKSTKKYLYNYYSKILENKKISHPCYAGLTHCVLDEVGNVYFCEMLPAIGNIRTNDFNKIWNSERAKKFRMMIKNKECYCIHSCFQNSNLVFNPLLYPKILIQGR